MCFIWFGNGERRKGEQTMSKGLEALKELKERLCFGYYVGEQVDTIEKELKALKIIKRLCHYDISFLDYVLDKGYITKEEYDLLKEVLL